MILLAKEKKCDYTNKRDTGEDRSSRERAMGERAGQLDKSRIAIGGEVLVC